MAKPTERFTLVSNKVPNATNFSNIRSYQYLAHPDNIPALFSQELLKSLPRLSQLNKFIINLNQLIKLEEIINSVLETVNQHQDLHNYIRDWWELSSTSTLTRIYTIFKDKRTKQTLKNSFRLEAMTMALTSYYEEIIEAHYSLSELIKELLFVIHQSYLVIVSIALHRLPVSSSTNNWAVSLQTIIHNKGIEKLKKSEHIDFLQSQNIHITEIIKQIITEVSIKETSYTLKAIIFSCIQILKDIDSFEVDTVREVLHTASLDEPEHIPLNTTESLDQDEDLPTVEPPFLPPLENENTYTLVLDLDETLIHYYESGNEGNYMIRPGCDEFLKEMSEHYEVVIFTAALQEYADWVIDQLDPNKYISYRLYRQHAIFAGNYYLKDLSRLGRDISKMLILDNVAENFQLQPDNGILIRSFFDDMTDNALLELMPLLKEIVNKKVSDVRKALRSFRDQMMKQIARGVPNPHLNLTLEDCI